MPANRNCCSRDRDSGVVIAPLARECSPRARLDPAGMAKGRRLTTSRSDRYLESYTSSYGNNYGSSSSELTEFGEEDVWSIVDDGADRNRSHEDDINSEWSPTTAGSGERRRVAIPHGSTGGLSLGFEDPAGLASSSPRIVHQFHGNNAPGPQRGGRRDMNMASSAPVNVPDWNKIYRVDSVESMHEDSDEDRGGLEMVPPHEYLARSRKMLATSVFEGQGRTLKGRDMRRVRDAIWSRTGFDG